MQVAAYVYPGWHPIEERDRSFHPGFTEWELVQACRPRFEGHAQPRVPLLGTYDDRDPGEVHRRLRLARELLEGGSASIDAVACRCGFGSAATLRHHFRQRLGTTPSSYRARFGRALSADTPTRGTA